VTFTIELELEDDGRRLAEVPALPGVLCYDADRGEVAAEVQALALRVIAERLEHRETPWDFLTSPSTPREQLARHEGATRARPLTRIGWVVKRQSGSHRALAPELANIVFAFHDDDELGPKMLARVSKRTGLRPEDL
jgi:predicted RNA binding protein YcfA (HicA-like mRNA interferase family)